MSELAELLSKVEGHGFQYPLMVAEGIGRGVAADILAIAAIMREGGILDKKSDVWQGYRRNLRSDPLFQLELFQAASWCSLAQLGLRQNAYVRAQKTLLSYKDIVRRLTDPEATSGDQEAILQAVRLGMNDQIFVASRSSRYNERFVGKDGFFGSLAHESILSLGRRPQLLVGEPFSVPPKGGWYADEPIKLIRFATEVSLDWLLKYAPEAVDICEPHTELPHYDETKDVVVVTISCFVHSKLVGELAGAPTRNEQKAQEAFTEWVIQQLFGYELRAYESEAFTEMVTHNRRQLEVAQQIHRSILVSYFPHICERARQIAWFKEKMGQATKIAELDIAAIRLPDVKQKMEEIRRQQEEKTAQDEAVWQDFTAAIGPVNPVK